MIFYPFVFIALRGKASLQTEGYQTEKLIGDVEIRNGYLQIGMPLCGSFDYSSRITLIHTEWKL